MSNKDTKTILDAAVEAVINLTEDTRPYGTDALTLDEAIDKALDTQVDFRFSNNGNTWERTTPARWGITERGLRQALRNRNYI